MADHEPQREGGDRQREEGRDGEQEQHVADVVGPDDALFPAVLLQRAAVEPVGRPRRRPRQPREEGRAGAAPAASPVRRRQGPRPLARGDRGDVAVHARREDRRDDRHCDDVKASARCEGPDPDAGGRTRSLHRDLDSLAPRCAQNRSAKSASLQRRGWTSPPSQSPSASAGAAAATGGCDAAAGRAPTPRLAWSWSYTCAAAEALW